jgi:hypothetical protein
MVGQMEDEGWRFSSQENSRGNYQQCLALCRFISQFCFLALGGERIECRTHAGVRAKEVFVLPILYKDCQIPLFLRDKVYADFQISYEHGLEAILERINPRK